MTTINQRQLQKQLQKLSPQQIQMIKLLELPALQLSQRIKQEIEENPILDEDVAESTTNEEGEQKEISVDEYIKEGEIPSYKLHSPAAYRPEDKQQQVFVSSGVSFHEFLEEQLGYKQLSERELIIARYLVGSIDDSGYLRRDLLSISDDLAFSLSMDVSIEELEDMLGVIHELEPAGVGARSLQECLLLQLDSLDTSSPERKLARRILTTYFDEFAKKHYDKLLLRLGVEEDELKAAIEEIMHLSPKPGNLYSGGGVESAPYVTPDFILDVQDGRFDLRLNSSNVPEVKINRRYVEMMRSLSDEGDEQSQEAMRFIKGKIESAKWFISAIKQRHDTLLSTMSEILDYQRDYFVDGNRSRLKPMILKDIADRTGLDVSTISRVVNSKYIQTHFGVIPLKQLFSEAMQTDSGEEVSSYEIKQILSECIEGEDKHRPLTDEALMDILNSKGYHIARRTVAKYREMLGIPVARLRKSF